MVLFAILLVCFCLSYTLHRSFACQFVTTSATKSQPSLRFIRHQNCHTIYVPQAAQAWFLEILFKKSRKSVCVCVVCVCCVCVVCVCCVYVCAHVCVHPQAIKNYSCKWGLNLTVRFSDAHVLMHWKCFLQTNCPIKFYTKLFAIY